MPTKEIVKKARHHISQPETFNDIIQNLDTPELLKLKSQLLSQIKKSNKLNIIGENPNKQSETSSSFETAQKEQLKNEIVDLLGLLEKRKFRSVEKSEALILFFDARKVRRNIFSVAYFDKTGKLLDRIDLKQSPEEIAERTKSEKNFSVKMVKLENDSNQHHVLVLTHPRSNVDKLIKIKKDLFRILE